MKKLTFFDSFSTFLPLAHAKYSPSQPNFLLSPLPYSPNILTKEKAPARRQEQFVTEIT